jgi:FkbM family methyltransferase
MREALHVGHTALRALRARYGTSRFAEPEFLMLDRIVDPGRPCIDVGANLGFYTFRLAALSPKVLSVEANPELARRLIRGARLSFTKNVVVAGAACGASAGSASFAIPVDKAGREDVGQAHLAGADEAGFVVQVATLDELILGAAVVDPGFIKIDVEGAELQVLHGATDTLTRDRPTILCEVQDSWTSRYGTTASDVFSYLLGFNYDAGVLEDGAFVPISAPRASSLNYLFCPR